MTRDPQLKTISTSAPDCATCGGAHPSGCGMSSGLDIYNSSDLHPYVYVRNNPINLSDPLGTVLGLEGECYDAYDSYTRVYNECLEEKRKGCSEGRCDELYMLANQLLDTGVYRGCAARGWWEKAPEPK